MSLDTTWSFILAGTNNSSQGASATALYVAEARHKGRRHLQDSYALSFRIGDVLLELRNVALDSSLPNWDGYGAHGVKSETLAQAERFLDVLPFGISAPSAGVDPDGQLTLEWYRSPHHVLSVSISPDGYLHYAAMLGKRTAYGTEPFVGEIPRTIMQLIFQIENALRLGAA